MKIKNVILVLIALVIGGWILGQTAIANATTPSATIQKYDTKFTYLGNNQWTVTLNTPQLALHNIGSIQGWLCNSNNVGPGISACVVGHAYGTNGEANSNGFSSCVFVQGDGPAFDTVPGDATKRVCANETVVTPPPPPVQKCITAAWTMPSWVDANTATWPQTLYGSHSAACGDLTWTDAPCGSQLQIDSYLDDSTTAALLAGKTLTAPGQPTEHLWNGGTAWKFVKGSDCAVVTSPPTETPTPTPTPTETAVPVPTPSDATPVVANQPKLAETGVNVWPILPVGLILVAVGAIVMVMKRKTTPLNDLPKEER